MISFRSHVVSLLSVFLALAIGVVLGGGPLSEVGRSATAEDVAAANSAAEQARVEAKQSLAFADQYAGASASRVLGNGLSGQTVVVLRLPGAPDAEVDALTGLVKGSGGSVVGTYQVHPALLDAGQNTLVDTLGSQLAASLKDTEAAGLATYPRIGRLMGRAVATPTAAGAAGDANTSAILESLVGADLASAEGESARRGALVLVVLGEEPTGADTDTILAGVTSGIRQVSNGVVVVGRTGSGLLAALRENDGLGAGVSTVDSVDSGAGRVVGVLALIAASSGKAGSFGASGSDGALPLG